MMNFIIDKLIICVVFMRYTQSYLLPLVVVVAQKLEHQTYVVCEFESHSGTAIMHLMHVVCDWCQSPSSIVTYCSVVIG